MKVCVLGKVIGEPVSLLHDTETDKFKWVRSPPNDAWILGDPIAIQSIDHLCVLSGRTINTLPDARYGRMVAQLRATDPDLCPRWRHILPADEFKLFAKRLVDDARDAVEGGNITYYTDVFKRTSTFLGSLEPARVNENKLYAYYAAEKNSTNRSTLKSFFPDAVGFAQKITYHQSATVTGRLTVASGPRVLILDKHKRDIITSSWPDGKVMMVDFRSLEPRIALLGVGRPTPEDIYTDINHRLFGDSFEYDRVKVMSLSLLYGAQEKMFQRLSGLSGNDARDAMDSLGSYFGVRVTQARLSAEFKASGFIKNHYGRVIRPKQDAPRLLYNYFVQSTAVDAALLGFESAVRSLRNEGWLIRPLFVIHDALVVDIHPNFVQYTDRLRDACTHIDGFDVPFPVRVEEL